MKKIIAAMAVLLFAQAAHASQNSLASGTFPTVSPYPGLTLVQNINSAMQAINSSNSGASAPTYEVEGTLFDNSTNNLIELYSGSAWLNWGSYTGSQFVPVSNGVPLGTCPTTTGSANAYVLTYSPVPTAYVNGQPYCFFTNFSNTGSATVNVNSLGALTLKKVGGTNLASADLGSGVEVVCIYDGTNCEIISQVASSGGGSGVSSFTGDGTLLGNSGSTGAVTATRANAGAWSVYSNSTSGSAAPTMTSTPSAQAYYLGTTQATAAGKSGLHSPASNTVALEANGNDAIYVTSGSKVGINNNGPTDYLDVGGAIGITATASAPLVGVYSASVGALDLSTSSGKAVEISPSGAITTGIWNASVIGPSYLASATSSAAGIVQPDNSTITISGGVISSTSGIPAALAIGSYVLAKSSACGGGNIPAGNTMAGSSLVSVNVAGSATTDSLTGTWRAMQTNPCDGTAITLFLRIS